MNRIICLGNPFLESDSLGPRVFAELAGRELPAEVELIDGGLALPGYEMVMKCSHTFNLLDARGAISVTERQRYILRVRTLARAVAQSYHASREALGFPMLKTAAAKEPA